MNALKHWLDSNPMSPHFMLNELKRRTGIDYELHGNQVVFKSNGSTHPIAAECEGKVYEIDTWVDVKEVTVPEVAEAVTDVDVEIYHENEVVDDVGGDVAPDEVVEELEQLDEVEVVDDEVQVDEVVEDEEKPKRRR